MHVNVTNTINNLFIQNNLSQFISIINTYYYNYTYYRLWIDYIYIYIFDNDIVIFIYIYFLICYYMLLSIASIKV